jgi:hypothetical protein
VSELASSAQRMISFFASFFFHLLYHIALCIQVALTEGSGVPFGLSISFVSDISFFAAEAFVIGRLIIVA